ncbi:MAG: type II secretion system F family protein [Verrucomicrobiota bacterium]
MPIFVYEALKSSGARTSGSITATTKQEAFRLVMKQGLQPVTLKSEKEDTSFAKRILRQSSDGGATLSNRELLFLTEDLSDLLDAGLQLEPALKTLEKRKGSPRLTQITEALRNQVREGTSFSHALKTTSKSFNDLYCSVVEAGELSGTLPQILQRQAQYLSAQMDLASKVRSALIYPAFLIVVGALLIIIFVTFLVPQLTELLTQTGNDLPMTTRVLITTSDFMIEYWWAIFTVFILILLGIWQFLSKPAGLKWWHTNQLKVPLFGPVLETRVYTQLTFTLGTLIANGIPLLKSLQLTNRGTPNLFLQERFHAVESIVEEGGSLSYAAKKHQALPSEIIDMINVGEQTGNLGPSLLKISNRFEKDLNEKLIKMTTLIQPVIIVFMALIIGLVAFSIFDAIFSTVQSLSIR